jgi:PAS domain S-box-containing protein
MPALFWVDVAALCVSAVIMTSMALVVVGARPGRGLNQSFALFSMAGGVWAVAALVLRLALWLNILLPDGPAFNTAFWLELTGYSLALMSNFAVRFSVRFLGRRTRWTDLILNVGLVLAVIFAFPLFSHQLVHSPRLTATGMVAEVITPMGVVPSLTVVAYLVWALILYWLERGKHREPYLAYAMLALLAGVVLSGILDVPFPILSISNAVTAALLAYAAVIRQLFNPLRELTIDLQHEIVGRVRSEARFRALSAAAFEGIGFHDQGVIVDANQQLADILGYPLEELPGMSVSEFVAPADREMVASKTLESGDDPYEHRVIRQDGTVIHVEVRSRTIDRGGTPLRVTAVRDITERVHAEEALRHYAKRLQILHEIEQGILAARSPEETAGSAVTLIRQLVPCHRVSINQIDTRHEEMTVLAADHDGVTDIDVGTRFSMEPFADLVTQVSENKVLLWTDLLSRGRVGQALYAEGIRAYLSAPLIFQGKLIGALNLASETQYAFSREDYDLIRQVADQLAIAIHQAQLSDQVQRHAAELERRVADRTQELSALYEVAALASQPLDLETILSRSLRQVLEVIDSESGVIHLLEEGNGRADDVYGLFRLAAQQGIRADLIDLLDTIPASDGIGKWILTHNEPLLVPDVTTDPRFTIVHPIEPRSFLGLPLRAGGRIMGVLGIVRQVDQPQLSIEELALLGSIADHMGIVVESARLHTRAEEAARLEERERLARELHDSVTQSLYSLTLFAEWGRDLYRDGEMEAVEERLIRMGETAQQALKEMRLLIYELRPALLEQEGLVQALERRLDAVEKRAGVQVSLETEQLGRLPSEVEVALYRIAQEALNNALKHASANQIMLRANKTDSRVTLEIEDNGIGFASETTRTGSGMGLINMRERARQLGGDLTISSTPGGGTHVILTVEVS